MSRLAIALYALAAFGGSLDQQGLKSDFEQLAAGFDGRVGVCAQDAVNAVCLRGDERFSLQSVMKLLVGVVVMDAVDHRGWRLDEPILVRKQDLSLYVQPIAKRVGDLGYSTTVGELVRGAIVQSDSAAADILIRKLGGPKKVQEFLDRKSLKGVRLDRQERDLQTEIVGLRWRPEYVDAAVLEQAIEQVPKTARAAAYEKYQRDPRDTATPRGFSALLQLLAEGRLVSPSSTAFLLKVMQETTTFPDRLKAGVPKGWTLGHKTGSSGSWEGLTVATNDVGILTAPDRGVVAISVFIADTRAKPEVRAALMAKLAAATIARYR